MREGQMDSTLVKELNMRELNEKQVCTLVFTVSNKIHIAP